MVSPATSIRRWMICVHKDRNKKLEKKEDMLRQDNMKRLQAMSLNFTTKLDDDASVLDFLCHILKLQPLLPRPEAPIQEERRR